MGFSYSIQCGLNAYHLENYVPYEELPHNSKNPEAIIIEKDIFEKTLSPEAQVAVYIICNHPEVFKTSKYVNADISWTSIRNYMIEQQKLKWKDVRRIRKEIEKWLTIVNEK